jgi:hypothetical protein
VALNIKGSSNPFPAAASTASAAPAAPSAAAPAEAADAAAKPALPDLIADAYGSFLQQPPEIKNNKLHYGFGVGNRGAGHLVLLGERPSADASSFKAFQVAYQGDKPVVVNEDAGTFVFEEDAHQHFHFADTAKFTLEKEGLADWKSEASKSHFLMMDTGGLYAEGREAIDPTIPATVGESKEVVESSGGDSPMTYRYNGKDYKVGGFDDSQLTYGQKISAGKVDYYGKTLNEDLALPEGKEAGHYTLTVKVDPKNKIVESNESNNTRRFEFDVITTQEDGEEKLRVSDFRSLDGVDGESFLEDDVDEDSDEHDHGSHEH